MIYRAEQFIRNIALFRHIAILVPLAACTSLYTGKCQKLPCPSQSYIPTSVPFLFEKNLIVVTVSIRGKLANFIVDTGLSGTMIDSSFAESLALPLRYADRKLTTPSSVLNDKAAFASGVQVQLGTVTVESHMAMVQDLSWVKRTNGLEIAGILGSDLLLSRVVTIDYSKNILVIDPVAPEADGSSVLQFNRTKLPILAAQFIGTDGKPVTGQFLIDTGSDDGVEVNRWFAHKHPKLFDTSHSEQTKEVGLGGLNEYESAVAKGLNLGKAHFSDIPVNIMSGDSGASGHTLTGILGNEFLSRFSAITIDYKHGVAFLRR